MLEKIFLSIMAFFSSLMPSYSIDNINADEFEIKPIIEPNAPGEKTKNDLYLFMDYSNVNEGYFIVTAKEESPNIKVKIISEDKELILPIESGSHAYSLPFGNGNYRIEFLRNVIDNSYQTIDQLRFNAEFDEFMPFLIPNSVVKFNQDSKSVLLSNYICNKLENDKEKVNAIYKWITKNINYDDIKAEQKPKWYVPNIDQVIDDKKGICMDQAALMVSMLRAQHIPAILVEGTYDKGAHAWVKAYADGEWLLVDPSMNIKNIDKSMNYKEIKYY